MTEPATRQISDHQVAVLVLVNAPGRDARDARNNAVRAMSDGLDDLDNWVATTTYEGHERTCTIVEVCDLNDALRAGVLTVTPTTTADDQDTTTTAEARP